MPSEARIEHHKLVSVPAAEVAISQELADVLRSEPAAPAVPTPAAKSEAQLAPHIPSHAAKVPRAAAAPPMTVGFEEAASFAGNAPPQYPDEANNHGWTGTVLLRLWVDAAGQVTKVHVERSSGYAVLDASAVNAVKHWKGAPARRNGRPVATQELLPVEFRIPRR
jgi:protein TonB